MKQVNNGITYLTYVIALNTELRQYLYIIMFVLAIG